MCGRYFLSAMIEELAAVFEVVGRPGPGLPLLPRFNVGPGQAVHAVRAGGGGRELVGLIWGLVPAWSGDRTIGYKTINARSETAHEKPAFREAFRHRRCLIPSNGFYEWKTGAGGVKQPFAVKRDGGALHAMAGLWERWHDPASGEDLETCTVLTCPANARLRGLHERMPVVLPRVEWELWLDADIEGESALRAMLKPDAARRWGAYPVSKRVNSPRHDDAGLLDEVMDESEGLFG